MLESWNPPKVTTKYKWCRQVVPRNSTYICIQNNTWDDSENWVTTLNPKPKQVQGPRGSCQVKVEIIETAYFLPCLSKTQNWQRKKKQKTFETTHAYDISSYPSTWDIPLKRRILLTPAAPCTLALRGRVGWEWGCPPRSTNALCI